MTRLIAIVLFICFSAEVSAGCVGTRFVVGGSSAVGAMVSGYGSYIAMITKDELELTASVMYRGRSLTGLVSEGRVQSGDKIKVFYEDNARDIRQLQRRILGHKAELRALELGRAPESAIKHSRDMVSSLETFLRGHQERRRGIYMSTYTKSFSDSTRAQLFIDEVVRRGDRVSTLGVLPRATAVKVARAARNGWVLLATAVALGIITSEETLVGHISCRLESEFNSITH